MIKGKREKGYKLARGRLSELLLRRALDKLRPIDEGGLDEPGRSQFIDGDVDVEVLLPYSDSQADPRRTAYWIRREKHADPKLGTTGRLLYCLGSDRPRKDKADAILDAKYVENKGLRRDDKGNVRRYCPYCKGYDLTDVEVDGFYPEDGIYIAEVRCFSCGKKWEAHFRLIAINEL